MPVVYAMLVILVCFLIFLNTKHIRSVKDDRRKGNLSGKSKVTMFDVRHLLMEGKKESAVQMYCAIFNTTVSKAKKDVEELERSLKV